MAIFEKVFGNCSTIADGSGEAVVILDLLGAAAGLHQLAGARRHVHQFVHAGTALEACVIALVAALGLVLPKQQIIGHVLPFFHLDSFDILQESPQRLLFTQGVAQNFLDKVRSTHGSQLYTLAKS